MSLTRLRTDLLLSTSLRAIVPLSRPPSLPRSG